MDSADLPEAGESVDLILRHVTRRFPEDFARALLPPGTPILTVMADVDKRNRGLRHAILPLLREEIIMESWVYTQGKLAGLEEGKLAGLEEGKLAGLEVGKHEATQRSLHGLFVRRLGRSPNEGEERILARRAAEMSPEDLVDVADLSGPAFAAWLNASR